MQNSLVAGLTASGADAYLLHVTTTPSVAYIARVDDFDCGIMISASHNPFYDNGIKLIDCYGSIGMVAVTTFLTLLVLVMNVYYSFHNLHIRFCFKKFQLDLLKEMWVFTFFIFINQIIDQINWSVDKFLLGRFAGTTAVAVYGVTVITPWLIKIVKQKEVTSEKTEERDPEVVAWENDEITSIEVKTVEVKPPVVPLPEEAAKAPKAHRLTAEEKEIKAAVMDTLKGQIAYHNDGMRASYRASNHSFNLLARNGVRIEGNTVTQNGEPLFKIHRRHAARKTQGCYRELMPTLEYVKQEQKQEKPSIRDQLKAAAKTQPEKKSPVKSKTHDMEL